jgi:hypothetical protein
MLWRNPSLGQYVGSRSNRMRHAARSYSGSRLTLFSAHNTSRTSHKIGYTVRILTSMIRSPRSWSLLLFAGSYFPCTSFQSFWMKRSPRKNNSTWISRRRSANGFSNVTWRLRKLRQDKSGRDWRKCWTTALTRNEYAGASMHINGTMVQSTLS